MPFTRYFGMSDPGWLGMAGSARWRAVVEGIARDWETALGNAAALLEGKVKPWNPSNVNLYWKRTEERDLMSHLIFCILTPQTRVEILDRILKNRVVARNIGFKGMDESSIAEKLRETGVRFPDSKALRIKDLHEDSLAIRSLLDECQTWSNSDLRHERWARDILIDEVGSGLGLKVASLFLKDVGYASHLAVLDSQNFRFAKKAGLMRESITDQILQNEEVYYMVEEWENDLASRLGVVTAALDWPIMDASG